MSESIDRRSFVRAAALAGAATALPSPLRASGRNGDAAPLLDGAPSVRVSGEATPVVVASANGARIEGEDGRVCVEVAWEHITGGGDVLEGLVQGVEILELSPEDTSVGYGGLPNGDGVVQLDCSVMHGPKRQAGAVAALEGVRTPSRVALAVMENTDHHLLVGPGAQNFARQMGLSIEDDLNSPRSLELWLEWKRRTDPSRWLDPARRLDPGDRMEIGFAAGLEMVRDGLIDAESFWGTINCNGVNANGDLAGVTTTSGLAWKIPGRVGDSPILGAGLYVGHEVGAAGSTGRGEANLFNLCSFLIVEEMRRGASPLDAGMEACRRIRDSTIESRLLNDRGLPAFGVNFYIVNARGEHAGVSLYDGPSYAVCDEHGPRVEDCEGLLEGPPRDG
jgi:N4-(beta-N-acetylglucosaminyl)-L-asparaginase